MSTQKNLSFSVLPRHFGVKVQWFWPAGARDGDVVAVQLLRFDGVTPVQFIRFPKDQTIVGGLKVGEEVQVRAQMLEREAEQPDWRASNWRDGKAHSDASDVVVSTAFEYVPLRNVEQGLLSTTAGDDIERQTLREVLVEVLPRTESRGAIAVAAEMATAVSAAFKRLDNLRDTDAGKS